MRVSTVSASSAIDVRTQELIWVEGEKKNGMLFILLLWELVQRYRDAKVIHVILDNYSIHSTRQVELSLESKGGQRLRLHFLPPYCPDHNRIERIRARSARQRIPQPPLRHRAG